MTLQYLGGKGKWFCDDSTIGLVLNKLIIGEECEKLRDVIYGRPLMCLKFLH